MGAIVRLLRFLLHLVEPEGEASKVATPLLSPEDLRRFMPTFLSQGSEKAFLDEIGAFARSDERPFYSSALRETPILFQGDGLSGLMIVRLPETTTKPGRALLLSNTCDVDPLNKRMYDASLTYAPILSLPRYLKALRASFSEERVINHEREIRQQLVTSIFFLPQGEDLDEDCLVFFDRAISASSEIVDREHVPGRRLFVLSDFGAWLLALKLSIHFCRIRDQVDRNIGRVA
jgi:hypothetical protein